uniref:Uncharacterized protein n=1 Tax=Anguilla anguilla TaxID=7936 RepID=A0A0E9XL02_ANGAN
MSPRVCLRQVFLWRFCRF